MVATLSQPQCVNMCYQVLMISIQHQIVNTLEESAPPIKMEVSAPHPLQCIIKLWKQKTLLWKDWSESKMVFIFSLVVVFNLVDRDVHENWD